METIPGPTLQTLLFFVSTLPIRNGNISSFVKTFKRKASSVSLIVSTLPIRNGNYIELMSLLDLQNPYKYLTYKEWKRNKPRSNKL